jgi:hypothetical protein
MCIRFPAGARTYLSPSFLCPDRLWDPLLNIGSLFPGAGSNIHVRVLVKLVLLTRRMLFRKVYAKNDDDGDSDNNNNYLPNFTVSYLNSINFLFIYVLDPKADKNNAKYEGNIIHVLNKTKHDAMKTYGGVGYLYVFLTSV